MKKILFLVLFLGFMFSCGTKKNASNEEIRHSEIQSDSITEKAEEIEEIIHERPVYHASPTIQTNLIHTKLEVDFNWAESQLNGVATITCKPHFYPTDSLILDAKSMEIRSVKIDGKELNFKYNDANFLRIGLDKEYTRNDKYTVVIDYIAKPNEKDKGGSSAIREDKGLYFINPTGDEGGHMTQVWTQGETESSSVWFPTIDRPNQRTTQEIYITVEDKYVTLSNGKMISSVDNGDGTRTDYWKQDLSHAPYLFMLAVGEFKIVKDSYTKKDGTVIPIWYYVEPEWEEHAKAIFGTTPEMMEFFTDLLGVPYVWDKYHQIVVREFVSGAMENTGAVVFGDYAYKTTRELLDDNDQATIAHELIHHWFGNLVTLESWSNLPLNESFANYSQYLWDEYKYGRDEADYNAEEEKNRYFSSVEEGGHHDMIWYDYDSHEDMFDSHSYSKGGRILHMLRYYLGDEAFFAGLKHYLKSHAFQSVEMADLRIAFEDVCGEDLNWFFNQWFFASGHPKIKITQENRDNQVIVRIQQLQDLGKMPLYKIPLKIGVYANDSKKSYDVVVDKSDNYFTFNFEGELQNVVVDEDRVILGEFDYEKPAEWYVHQYYHAPRLLDRIEAINKGSILNNEASKKMILDALDDDYWVLRYAAISYLDEIIEDSPDKINAILTSMIKNDENSTVRGFASQAFGRNFYTEDYQVQTRATLVEAIENDQSYKAVSSALEAFVICGLQAGKEDDIQKALSLSKNLENEKSSTLKGKIIEIYSAIGDESHLSFMKEALTGGDIKQYDLISALFNFTVFYSELEFKTQRSNFDVFEKVYNKRNLYTNYILPSIVMGLQQNASERIASLESEEHELLKAGKQDEASMIREDIKEGNRYIDRINSLAMKIMNEK
ncbi:MAG: M1 family aminopeptidase [Brumimicrobium sp.]